MGRHFAISVGILLLIVGGIPVAAQEIEQALLRMQPVELETSSMPGTKVFYLYQRQGQETIGPLSNSTLLRVGDGYGLAFIPGTDGYIYVFQSDVNGKMELLFPDDGSFNNVNPVQQGHTYYVPLTNEATLKAVSNPLVENLFMLLSKNADSQVEKRYQVLLESRRRGDRSREKIVNKSLQKIVQERRVSGVSPMVHQKWVDANTFREAGTAREIVDVLNIRLPQKMVQLPIIGGETKGLSDSDDTVEKQLNDMLTDELLAQLPVITLVNLFEPGSATPVPESLPLLFEYGKAFQELDNAVFVIAAHTDDNNSAEAENQMLSRQRAAELRAFWKQEFDIDEDQFILYPYGSRKPLVSNWTEKGRRVNNRVELIRIQ